MKKFAAGLLLGLLIATAIFLPFLHWQKQISWELGVTTGTIQGKRSAAEALGQEFGQIERATPSKNVFSVKHTDVVSIETNGIKTVRVIP